MKDHTRVLLSARERTPCTRLSGIMHLPGRRHCKRNRFNAFAKINMAKYLHASRIFRSRLLPPSVLQLTCSGRQFTSSDVLARPRLAPAAPNNAVTSFSQIRGFSSSPDPGRFMSQLARRLMWIGLLLGVSGAAILYMYSRVMSSVERRLSWLDAFLPHNLAQGLSSRLERAAEWASGWGTGEGRRTDGGVQLSQGPSSREKRLEKENKELTSLMERKDREILDLKNALRRSGDGTEVPGPKSLIDMYSEVLTLLAEFDANAKEGRYVDQLPKVVVVGDQSAGKTSVLEMVAGARIFPRGAGEMMTRSPVMVTLSDSAEHVAQFRDSHQVYHLDQAADLKALRGEIERRMVGGVGAGQSVSSEPLPLTVRGPNMKRMVLVDLPGVISTVTAGMAADTRESITRICKRYMQNPNAIIMCIQDGGVDAERSIVTDLVREVDPEGRRTIFVLTKVDLAEKSGVKADRVKSILEGRLFPMKALGYFAVVTGSGNPQESIHHIQKYEKDYFSRSKLFQSGTVMETQLGTRNMVLAVTKEFWKVVNSSIHDQVLKFKGLRYRLEAEWRNKFPGERVLDRGDIFEVEKASLLREVASLALVSPAKWEGMFYERLWKKMAPYALETILMEASQAEDFGTEVDIALRKWAEDRQRLPSLCALAAQETTMEVLRNKIEATKGGPFHALGQGMREYVEKQCLEQLRWSPDNVEQLCSVQITTLEDKDVRDQEQWSSAASFLDASLQGQIRQAEADLKRLTGPASLYERWVQWESTTPHQADTQLLVEEVHRILQAEPSHSNKMAAEDVMTVQRILKSKGHNLSQDQVLEVWSRVYKVHFLKQALKKANTCKRAFYLRQHDPQNYSCPQVVYMWRVQQLMKRCAHTLRVQLMDCEVRQLELQVKTILNAISGDDQKKKDLIKGFAVDKAEQLKQVRLIQEKLEVFQNALKKDKLE